MNRTPLIRLIALGAALTFTGGALALAFPREESKPIRVTAYFSKAIGLFEQSHVRVLGVSVGRVVEVSPAGEKVKVEMRIDGDRKIPADAGATIVPISLISDRYVQLFPVYSSGPALADGAVIDTDRTTIPFELDDVLAQLKKFLDAVEAGTREDPESIGAAIRNLASALAGVGDDFSRALGAGGALSEGVLEHQSELDGIVVHLSRLTAALAERHGDLTQLNTRLAQALGALASERGALDRTLVNVATLTEELSSLVAEHRSDLETDLSILVKTTQAALRHQDSVSRSLSWLPVLADGAEESHEGGAIHSGDGPTHVDVRDAHLVGCPPGVPGALCLLLGLTGYGLPLPATAAAPSQQPAEPQPQSAPDPSNLLGLLPTAPVDELLPITPARPHVRGFFERIGGFFDRALRWM